MRNSFVLISGSGVDRSLICVARVLLLFRLDSDINTSRTKYVFLQYMQYTPALDEVDEVLRSVLLRWSATDAEDRSYVGGRNGMRCPI